MKKILKFIFIITIAILNFTGNLITKVAYAKTNTISVDEQNYGYYKCLSACLFFKSSDVTDMSLENIYFTIPEGYFVKKINDITATTLKVTYNNKVGYVMSERVRLVSFLPTIKYLEDITFNISPISGTQLWSTPSSDDNKNIIYKHIEAGTKNISYIASVNGEIPQGATSSLWYFCTYSPASDPTSVYEGYIHSEKTSNLTPIPENTEDDIIINEANNSSTSPFNLSTTMQTILITVISLPLLTIIVLLLLGTKRKEKLKLQTEMISPTSEDDYCQNNNFSNKIKTQNIKEMQGKRYSIKDKFNDFMFESEKKSQYRTNQNFSFQNLDTIDEDEDLL